MFARHWRVCSWIVGPAISPLAASKGPCPDTKTRPAARMAWLYENDPIPAAWPGAFGVVMTSRDMAPPRACIPHLRTAASMACGAAAPTVRYARRLTDLSTDR